MKTNKFIFLLMIAFSCIACHKEIDISEEIKHDPTPVVLVESSVIGFVSDEMGVPLEDAKVEYGNLSVSTDENGVFQFTNQILNQSGSFIKVYKSGYFSGSRTFYPRVGNVNKIEVQLMEEKEVGFYDANDGAEISFEDVTLTFAPNGIVDENGIDFNGTVHVSAHFLDPTLAQTHREMPGDLTAINNDDELVSLTSYAMIAVELTTDTGAKLQLKEGFPTIAKIPVPTSLLSSAPSTIPLWSFDEGLGRWVEEGQADLVNGFYIGELTHFSFWNCDVPGEYADLEINVYNYESPFADVQVKITEVETGGYRVARTDENGFVAGKVPANTPLLIEIIDNCDIVIQSVEITLGPGTTSQTMTTTYDNFANIVGHIDACDGEISESAYVKLFYDNSSQIVVLDENDNFSAHIIFCDEGNDVQAKAYDPTELVVSNKFTLPLTTDVDFGDIEMCEDFVGNVYSYNFGDVSLFLDESGSNPDYSWHYENTYITDDNNDTTKIVVTVTTLEWITGIATSRTFLFEFENPDNFMSFGFPEYGFSVSGIGESYVVNSAGENFMIFEGSLSDMEISDEDLYDPSYSPFNYYFAFKYPKQ